MEIVCSDMFVLNLDKCIEILDPINIGINSFQNDYVSLSKVYKYFAVMKQSYKNINCLTC